MMSAPDLRKDPRRLSATGQEDSGAARRFLGRGVGKFLRGNLRKPGPTRLIRLVGAALLAALALLTWVGAPWAERQQAAWFDLHQTLRPREAVATPVLVVEIDQASLRELGQWPWPRTHLASIIEIVGGAGAAVIGIDILMSEADGLSPEQLATQGHITDPEVLAILRRLPTHDARLAKAVAAAPVVLAMADTSEANRTTQRLSRVAMYPADPAEAVGVQDLALPHYAGALTNIAEVDAAAHGWGLISVTSTRGIVRRIPLVSEVNQGLVPTLALEMLRVYQHASQVRLEVAGRAVRGVGVGKLLIPTERDAGVWPYFAPRDPNRFVSAVKLLKDRVDLLQFNGKLVLIGITGAGLDENHDTPIGERISAIEVHAQLLDNLVGGSLLRRPNWASAAEATLLVVLGALLLWATPRWHPLHAGLLALACAAVALALGVAAFVGQRLLIDAITPTLHLMLLFLVLRGLTLADLLRQRRTLQRQVQGQREHNARMAGELQAARQVQAATLPQPDLLAADSRIALHARLAPAREVGGDLYDFFMLDRRRLFVLVGDVAGKGLSASIFMAVSKALYKSATLRLSQACNADAGGAPDIGAIMRTANQEVSRDNAQMLFVTVFAAILDLDSGLLEYCNAGHDNPYRLHASHAQPLRIADGDGPPLCAMPAYPYQGARCQLLPGEVLCLMTDGVAEAQSPDGKLFGHERVDQALRLAQQQGSSAYVLVEDLSALATAFAAGLEPADDMLVLALRWSGPP